MPASPPLLPAVRAVARGFGFAPFRGGRWSFSSAAAVLGGRRPKNIRWPKGFRCVASAVDSEFYSTLLAPLFRTFLPGSYLLRIFRAVNKRSAGRIKNCPVYSKNRRSPPGENATLLPKKELAKAGS